MSGSVLREHSYLKVLYDFEYKTAEGREIIIKKNERLYLVQKTNDDWWQVVRNLEQRPFYVPATYVREVSKNYSSTRKNSEEEGIFEPPQDPSYKSMPKESSNAMRNVKKWLAGAMDGKSETSKTPYDSEVCRKLDASEGATGGKLKVNLADSKSKSLERDKRSGHYSDRDDEAANVSPRSSVELTENSKAINRFGTSPKNIGGQFRLDASLQDPFRRELESSLDRRNLSGKTCGKIGARIRTKSSNSDGSFGESDDFHREIVDKIEEENSCHRRSDISIRDEISLTTNRESLSSSETSSKSFELEGKKMPDRNVSPKNNYGRQMTIAGGSCAFNEKTKEISSGESSSDHKILTDKRRTWAVEELMSELTQMCKERVTKKKPDFELKSTEVKSKFDPLEKLTREIHEMNRLRSEKTVENSSESMNVCKISINSSNSPNFQTPREEKTFFDSQHEISEEIHEKFSGKCLKSPKSPKILDEFNEANILNDCRGFAELRDIETRSLSSDKQSFYQKRSSCGKSSPENVTEAPCYSNVKLNADKVKLRAKLKIKMSEPCAELKLTPSLEKLASEIQFLPAKRTNQSGESNSGFGIEKSNENPSKSEEKLEKSNESIDKIDCRKILKNFKEKLTYKGSFKSKREKNYDFSRKYENLENLRTETKNRGLTKSFSINCAKLPEAVGKYRGDNYSSSIFQDSEEIPKSFKRRSRSLTDLDCLEIDFTDTEAEKNNIFSRKTKSRPVPLPRTKIPAIRGFSNEEMSKNSEENSFERSNNEKMLSKTIPELRKTCRRENLGENGKYEKFGRSEKLENAENSGNIDKFVDKHEFSEYFQSESQKNRLTDSKIRRNFNIESSTAIGFKSLLCASDSGSDNCLQSKDLLSNSVDNFNSVGSSKNRRKLNSAANLSDPSRFPRESLSDEQILSSNASSDAIHSQSESEATATFDISSHPSPINAKNDGFECAIDLPPGWKQIFDSDTGQICFVNGQGDKWFSSNDAEGKIYFFEENSNESSWVLPTVESEKSHSTASETKQEEKVELDISATLSDKTESGNTRSSIIGNQNVPNREFPTKKATPSGGDWPHLCDGNNMLVLKEGIINRTKITENGKKLRKNWSTSYAVLTELFLLFFKDAKTFTMMKTGQSSMAKPDISVDLNGTLVEPGDRASSRKNVYMISTVLGLQVLVQSDNTALATEWFQEIHGAIRKLPSGFKFQGKPLSVPNEIRKISGGKQTAEGSLLEDTKRFSKIARSRSMKMKRLDDSLEDLSGSAAERQTKIKAKLRRFFQRRPAVELLVKNGIYKDEPAFGSYLSDVCPTESPRVPIFVKTCIEVLESKEENMKTDGLYRASGNLSQIQKIRLQVDQYKLDVLSQEEDVHVLAGALKLFFRELKEPLIPSTFFKEAVNASMLKKSSAKIQCFREIVKALPPPNYDTLQFLLKHLLRVTSYQEFNRMHIPNLAIVFGPTLMWPAEESANMALDFMQQNLVIECLLSEYNKIFK